MRFNHEALRVMAFMIQKYGFAPVTITPRGLELLPMPEAVRLAQEIAPEVKEALKGHRGRRARLHALSTTKGGQ